MQKGKLPRSFKAQLGKKNDSPENACSSAGVGAGWPSSALSPLGKWLPWDRVQLIISLQEFWRVSK